METRVIISMSKLSTSIFIAFVAGVVSGVIIGILIGYKIKRW